MKLYALFLILIFVSKSYGTSGTVAELGYSKKYWDQCPLPSSQNMEKELLKDFSQNSIDFYNLSSLSGISFLSDKIKYINIDGFQTRLMSDQELNTLMALTSHSIYFAKHNLYAYKIDKKLKEKTLYITRTFRVDPEDSDISGGPIYDLGKVKNEKPYCSDIICAAKRIFGNEKGVLIVYAMKKYGLHLSRYSHPNSDPNGLSLKLLKSVLMAAKSTPFFLVEKALRDQMFFLAFRDNEIGLANSSGYISKNLLEYDKFAITSIITHEIAHRIDYHHIGGLENLYEAKFSSSAWWLDITGFNRSGMEKVKNTAEVGSVSKYGETSPVEDFAETYTMYRYAPNKLKEISPERYEYIKKIIFDDRIYTEDFICYPRYL